VEAALLTPLLGLIPTPGIIDEQIKPALLTTNAVNYGLYLCVIAMIAVQGNSMASRLTHQRGGLVNRSGRRHRRVARMLAPSGQVHDRTRRT